MKHIIKHIKHCFMTAVAHHVKCVGGSSKFWYWRGRVNLTSAEANLRDGLFVANITANFIAFVSFNISCVSIILL